MSMEHSQKFGRKEIVVKTGQHKVESTANIAIDKPQILAILRNE